MWQNVTTSNYRFMKSQLLTVLTFIASAYPLEQTHLVEQGQVGLLSNQCSPTFRLEHSQGHLGALQRGEVEGFGGFTAKPLTEQILSESLLIYNPMNYRSLAISVDSTSSYYGGKWSLQTWLILGIIPCQHRKGHNKYLTWRIRTTCGL